MSGTLVSTLTWWARNIPDQPAIDFDGDVVTYRQLESWADGIAADLVAAGVGRGDRVALVGQNSLEWCAATLGALKLGAVVAPFNHRMVARELAGLLEDCEPTVVYGDDALRERLEEARREQPGVVLKSFQSDVRSLRDGTHAPVVPPVSDVSETAAIVYTSGTTGKPKGVIFTHATIAGEMHEWSLMEPVLPNGFRPLLVLPLFTAAGLVWGLFRTILHGGTLLLQPRFDPARALRVLADQKVTTFTGPPILFEQVAAQPGFAEADLTSLTTAHVGGARVPVDLLASWQRKGVSLRQIYGQTEIGGSATVMPRDEAMEHPEKCGWGGAFTRIRVVDPEGVDCPPGTPGQILLRGPGMMPGYWRNEEATRTTIVDGWLHTGDMGILDERGYLTFVDRMKDMIISGGLNISPTEIENVLQEMPGIEEVAVIAVEDAKFGETSAALIKADGPIDPADVVAHCNERMADYKVPRYVVLLDEALPRMASGKIAKRDLKATYADLPRTHGKVR